MHNQRGEGSGDELSQAQAELGCFANVSPSRPPVLNEDNLSSQEVGKRSTGADAPAAPVPALVPAEGGVDIASYPTSTADSVQTPNDNEAVKPNARFLPVTAPPGLGESAHKRRASIEQVNEQKHKHIRLWVRDVSPTLQPQHELHYAAWRLGIDPPLRQDTHVRGDSNMATHGGSSRRDTSDLSRDSGSSYGTDSLDASLLLCGMEHWALQELDQDYERIDMDDEDLLEN